MVLCLDRLSQRLFAILIVNEGSAVMMTSVDGSLNETKLGCWGLKIGGRWSHSTKVAKFNSKEEENSSGVL